jgi:protein AFG1
MTRSPTYAHEEWLPLQEFHRRWEKVALSVPPVWRPLTGSQNMAKPSPGPVQASTDPADSETSDFADEAGYSRPSTLAPKAGRSPPIISEDHMWGVRDDWGKKAGAWGQGTKAKKPKKEDEE